MEGIRKPDPIDDQTASGEADPEVVSAADRPDASLAALSAAVLFAGVPLVLGAVALASGHSRPAAVVLAVGGASLATALVLAVLPRLRAVGLGAVFAADVWGVALIAVAIDAGGHYHSPYAQLYLLAVVHAAAFQPRARTAALTLLALLAYLMPAVAVDDVTSANAAGVVIPALTIILAAGVVYAAAARLRRQLDVRGEREAVARRLADQDPLTGLGNYRLFWRAAEGEVARVRRHGGAFSLVLLDLDRFKAVNDDLGHRAGDAVLQRVAGALRATVRREDVACRHGGDEFAVVAVQAGPDEAAQLAERLVDAVAEAGRLERHHVTATAGWATYGVHAGTTEDLVLRADDAMRAAKRAGRGPGSARAIGAPEPATGPAAPEPPARVDGSEAARLAFVGGLARALAAAGDERTAAETAVGHLAGAVDAVVVAIDKFDRSNQQLELLAFAGPPALGPAATQPADAGILGAAVARELPLLVGDVRDDERYGGVSAPSDIRSQLALPVFERGEVWGVLSLQSDRVDAYGEDDVRLVQAVAVQLGRVLTAVWALSRLGEGRVEFAYEVAAALQQPGEERWRVADLAWQLAREVGLEGAALESLYLAALFHDVGTVGVPASLLLKAGRLNDQELALMREHPAIGERLLRAVPRLRGAAAIVRHEHERFDGDGYPDGLAGDEIPLASRLLLACDAYVAMTSARTFRAPLTPAEAVSELRGVAGSQLDPGVVAALLELFERDAGVEAGADAVGAA